MESDSVKVKVWTEGLGEFWGVTPENHERRQREAMSAEDLHVIVTRIIEENSHDATGLFILESNNKRLHLNLSNGVIEMSDPRDANYQNVAIAESELIDYLNTFFAKAAERESGESAQSPLIRTLEYVVAAVAIIALGMTVRFVMHYMETDSQFLPAAQVSDIGNVNESRKLVVEVAGVYITSMGDGEMALELKEDQTWAFYDMSKGSMGSFVLDKVSGGTYQPVYEAGRPAILTDNRYLYYPSQGRDQLEFMQRFFKRVGNTRDDLPYLSFPDEPKGTVATR